MHLKNQFINKDVLSLSISIFLSFSAVKYSSLQVISHGEHVLDAFIAFFFVIGFYISVKKVIYFIFN